MALTPWRVKPALSQTVKEVIVGAPPATQSNALLLGRTAEVTPNPAAPVFLSHGKEQVVAVVGKRGSGKTFTLGCIVEGLSTKQIQTPVGNSTDRRGVIVFDPLDNYWTMRFPIVAGDNEELNRLHDAASRQGLLNLEFDVECWLPGRTCRRQTDPKWFRVLLLKPRSLLREDWELMLNVNTVSDPVGQALLDTIRLASYTGYQKNGQQAGPREDYSITDIVNAVDSDTNSAVYHPETLRALRQRLQSIESQGIFDPAGTNIQELSVSGRASIILLSRASESLREIIISLVVRGLMSDRSEASNVRRLLAVDTTADAQERTRLEAFAAAATPKTTVFLDEAQNFLAPDSNGPSKAIITKLVKEGRNFGLSVVLATQQPSAIDKRILSQVETFIAHSLVTESDIRSVRDNLKCDAPESIQYSQDDLDFAAALRRLSSGQCIVSSSNNSLAGFNRLFFMNVRARATMHGGLEL
ncbi:ATP-binding protein [Prosthecomicrobium sp. N25]|uniref:ATP-binding protein n=1 Tax=Prosthecomicrobium sp. N25 TaxID=3129254 RepID=UPI003076920A